MIISIGERFPSKDWGLLTKTTFGFANNYNNVLSIGNTASTSPVDLTAVGSSTTFSFRTGDVGKINLLLQFNNYGATTSALNIAYEYSDNNIDWYGEDNMTQTSNILGTHGSTTMQHLWSPINTINSTVRKSIIITPLSEYIKITFTAVTGASKIWAKAITQVVY